MDPIIPKGFPEANPLIYSAMDENVRKYITISMSAAFGIATIPDMGIMRPLEKYAKFKKDVENGKSEE